jgi:hypothetical protein
MDTKESDRGLCGSAIASFVRITTTADNELRLPFIGLSKLSGRRKKMFVKKPNWKDLMLGLTGLLLLMMATAMMGCTGKASKLAIINYTASEQQKQLAFNNSYRTSNQQLLLNLTQYVKAHPEKTEEAIRATWQARNELEDMRVQFIYGRVLSMLTVGQYLYDKQGVLNVWLEGKASMLGDTSTSLDAAKSASGIGIKDITKMADPTGRSSPIDLFKNTLKALGK